MVSPFSFIVEPKGGKRYDNTVKAGDIDLILSSSKEDHTVSNREAVVISCPSGYKGPVYPGDILIVHHNVFKVYNDMQRMERSGKSYFKDGLYLIDDDQWFAYKRDGKLMPKEGFCFIKPSKTKEYFISKPGSRERLHGTVVIADQHLINNGIRPGDEVIFTEDSEYEFRIDGDVYYRVYSKDVCMVL